MIIFSNVRYRLSVLHREGALIVEDTARSVSPAALYEKLEQVYRLLCGKVGSRSLGSGQGRYL